MIPFVLGCGGCLGQTDHSDSLEDGAQVIAKGVIDLDSLPPVLLTIVDRIGQSRAMEFLPPLRGATPTSGSSIVDGTIVGDTAFVGVDYVTNELFYFRTATPDSASVYQLEWRYALPSIQEGIEGGVLVATLDGTVLAYPLMGADSATVPLREVLTQDLTVQRVEDFCAIDSGVVLRSSDFGNGRIAARYRVPSQEDIGRSAALADTFGTGYGEPGSPRSRYFSHGQISCVSSGDTAVFVAGYTHWGVINAYSSSGDLRWSRRIGDFTSPTARVGPSGRLEVVDAIIESRLLTMVLMPSQIVMIQIASLGEGTDAGRRAVEIDTYVVEPLTGNATWVANWLPTILAADDEWLWGTILDDTSRELRIVRIPY